MTILLKPATIESVVLSILNQPSGVAHKFFAQDVLNVIDSSDNNNFYKYLLLKHLQDYQLSMMICL